MNCPNCNTLVESNADRCPKCGYLLVPNATVLPNPVEMQPVNPAPMPNVQGQTPPVNPVPQEMPDITLPPLEAPVETPQVASAPVAPVQPAPVVAPTIEPVNNVNVAMPVPTPMPADEDAYKVSAPPVEPIASPAPNTMPSAMPLNPTPQNNSVIPEQPIVQQMPASPMPAIEPVIEPLIEPAVDPNGQTSQVPETKPIKEKKKAPVTLILAILLLLLIVSAALILYSRGFFDNIFKGDTAPSSSSSSSSSDSNSKDNNQQENSDSSDSTDKKDAQTNEATETTPNNASSFLIGGYEFSIPVGYEYKMDNNQVHLVNKDGTADIIVVDVYRGTKTDLQNIVPDAKSMIEQAGYSYVNSHSGNRNSKYFLNIGYTSAGVKYETIMMLIDEEYILSLTSLKTDGIETNDFINLTVSIVESKASSSKANSDLKNVCDAFKIQNY